MDYAYYNGVISPYDAMTVGLNDRALFFGDAVYDVMIGRNGKIHQLDEHLSRLKSGTEFLRLSPNESYSQMKEIIEFLINECGESEYMIYIQISGSSRRRIHKSSSDAANLLITVSEFKSSDRIREISAITLPDLRYGYCNIKTVNLLPAVISVNKAIADGADIAIFHKDGMVTECSNANISILAGNRLITHPRDSEILAGIMRGNLISACLEFGIEIEERAFTKEELMACDCALITSTTQFIRLCSQIDGVTLEGRQNNTANELFRCLYSSYLNSTC